MDITFEEVLPLRGPAKNLVVMLHGVGSNAKDLISIAPYMRQSLEKTHFISLNAPNKYDMAPFGYQWFSLQNRELSILQKGLAEAVPHVVKFLEDKTKELNLKFEDVFLMGFSQGSMVSTHVAMSFNKKLAGVVGMSGSIIPRPVFEGNNQTPICLMHGTDDEVISVDTMYRGEKYLGGLGFNVQAHVIPFLGHSIDVKCITIAVNFIKNHHAG